MWSFTTISFSLLVLFIPSYNLVGGIKVANFQNDGFYSASSHLRLRGGMPRSLKDFTMCVRLNLNYLRGDKNHWLSISNDTSEDILVGVLEKDPSSAQHLLVTLRRFHQTVPDFISVRLKSSSIFHSWRHFCFVFASYPLLPSFPLSGQVNLTGKAYLDGILVAEVHNLVPKRTFVQIPSRAKVILGQRRTLGGLRFNEEESFAGGVADLRFWREELVEGEIQNLARCKHASSRGLVLDWDLDEYERKDVKVEDIRDICFSSSLLSNYQYAFTDGGGVNFAQIKSLCDSLGGQLPTFDNRRDREDSYVDIVGHLRVAFVGSEGPSCVVDETEYFFWTGIAAENASAGVFYNLYDGKSISWDPNLWPGPLDDNFTCTMVRGKDHLSVVNCDSKLPCGVCEFSQEKRLLLKGLCAEDKEDFDAEYYPHGILNGMIHFKGIRSSHMYFDSQDERWTLQSLKNPKRTSKLVLDKEDEDTKISPIGRLTWEVMAPLRGPPAKGICNLSPSRRHTLVLSGCSPSDQFTCSDGGCVDRGAKCDGAVDCADGSDEDRCHFLVANNNYSKWEPPPSPEGSSQPASVFFNLDIGSVAEVNPAKSTFRSDYRLRLRWYDPRLKFRELDRRSSSELGSSERTFLWSPKLDLVNAVEEPSVNLGDEKSSLRLIREEVREGRSEEEAEDFFQSDDRLFSGSDNSLLLTRRMNQEHRCHFDFYYFPFDAQICAMVFQISDESENLINFKPEDRPINFKGDRSLLDYTLESEHFDNSSSNTMSVYLILRRRTQFHSINAFVQTFVILLASGATFFFDEDDFSDRILVNAVLLLACATINSSIQSMIPQTSYFKLVDIWLLFCVSVITMSILINTAIAFFFNLGGGSRNTLKQKNEQRAFKRIRSNSGTSMENSESDDEDNFRLAKLVNLVGFGVFVGIIVLFNIVFWSVALREYKMEGEQLLEEKRPIR